MKSAGYQDGCRLGCIALLITLCSGFQFKIPSRIATPVKPGAWHKPKFLSRRTPRNKMPLQRPAAVNLSSSNSTDYDSVGSGGMSSSTSLANGDSHDRNYYPMGITEHYFEKMEERSGKDYRWIKPLAKPVSRVMM